MTLYLKRAIQGRYRDARKAMSDVIATRAAGQYIGNFYIEYEPYYLNTTAVVSRAVGSTERLITSPGFSSGIYNKEFSEWSETRSNSTTTPPQLAY
jgi:hypothetical protein